MNNLFKVIAIVLFVLSNTACGQNVDGSNTVYDQNAVSGSLWNTEFNYPPKDENGWSIVLPSNNSRLIYVSSTEGDDQRAKFYTARDIKDPFNPSGIIAFKGIFEAMKLVRSGFPDWILLKKGDEWVIDKAILGPSGQSRESPFVFTSYGNSTKRPLIKTGVSSGFTLTKSRNFVSIIGIEFYAHKRDPNSDQFIGWADIGSPAGFASVTNDEEDVESILLEDNVFRFYSVNIQVNGKRNSHNIIIRRNQVLDSYSASSHSQGLFISNASLLLEENLFDHNGWFKKRFGVLNDRSEGQATLFNHNAYMVNMKNSAIKNNIFSRASSIGAKIASNSDQASQINSVNSYNLSIDNNFFVEGEIGISIGGNTDFNNGYRWQNINVVNNVMLNIGGTEPTDRRLAFHIDINDWDGGDVSKNYLLYNDNVNVTNVTGINVEGLTRNVTIHSNVLHNIYAREDKGIFLSDGEKKTNVKTYDNLNENSDFKAINRRDISSYMEAQGISGGFDSFIAKAKKQAKDNWNTYYSADTLNQYLRDQLYP